MANVCSYSITRAVSRSGSDTYKTTGVGTVYINYSITQDLADRVVITSKVVGSANVTHRPFGENRGASCVFDSNSTANTWTINTSTYSINSSASVTASTGINSTSASATADFSPTQTTTVYKTHAKQNIPIKGYYSSMRCHVSSEYGTSSLGEGKSVSTTIEISARTSYTVSFNANGGSGAPSAQTKWYGETLTLSSTKPTRTGYTFLGWSTSSTATSATYAAGGSYAANSAATLYAVWKLNTYSVTYNARGGSPTPSAQTKTYGVNLTLSGTVPTFAGYTFKGWATSLANAQAGTVNYAKGATYTGNAALTLYAVWELTYTKPKITSISVARCAQDGGLIDNGDYAKVTFDWSVFRSSSARYYGGSTTPYSANGVSNCTVTVGTQSTTLTLSGASGTNSYAILGGVGSFEDDQSYKATVSITDSQTIYSDHTISASVTLPPLFYPMDFNADASAVGFFMPAPDSGGGIYSGKDIHFFVDENSASGDDYAITETLNLYGWTDVLE